MNKEEKKKPRRRILISIMLLLGILFYIQMGFYGIIGTIRLGIILILELAILFLDYLKSKGIIKIKEKEKIDLSGLSKEELKCQVKKNLEYNKEAGKILEKMPKDYQEKIQSSLITMIFMGTVIFIFGIFYLGAIPSYFGVNDELINPTNTSLGINATMESIKDVGIRMITDLSNKGRENPKTFFWLWWVTVFMFMIYPLLKIIYYSIKEIRKYFITKKLNFRIS